MPQLRINTDAVVAFTNKLEKLPRTAFPVAVRAALNSAAFDMKKNTLPKSAKDNFVQRKPSFFKANSRVEMAKGFDINRMQSVVGFTGKDQAIDDLEKQEFGGKINSRAFIPMAPARTSNSNNKLVRPNARLRNLKLVDASKAEGVNDKQKFVKSVFYAWCWRACISNEFNGKSYVWKVNSLSRTEAGSFKLTPIYSYEKGRDVKVDSTNFMSKATEMTSKKMDDFYIKAAEFQFKRALQ
jgi:hypothetical protein